MLKNNSDDHFTFVVTMLGNSEENKNVLVSSSNYKNQNLLLIANGLPVQVAIYNNSPAVVG